MASNNFPCYIIEKSGVFNLGVFNYDNICVAIRKYIEFNSYFMVFVFLWPDQKRRHCCEGSKTRTKLETKVRFS